jgi:hypothetical protein
MSYIFRKKYIIAFLSLALSLSLAFGCLLAFSNSAKGQTPNNAGTNPSVPSGSFSPPGGTAYGPDSNLISSQSVDDNPGAQVAILLSLLSNIKFDTSLFTNNAILASLHDFTLTVVPEPFNRHDPFAPIGTESTPSTNSSSGSSASGNGNSATNQFTVDQSASSVDSNAGFDTSAGAGPQAPQQDTIQNTGAVNEGL